MKIKEGVSLRLLKPQMAIAAIVVKSALDKITYLGDCVITSGDEGKHKTGSKHPMGEALDFRTKNFSSQEQLDWKIKCQSNLGSDYDVVLSKKKGKIMCLHVEWDPK